MASKAIEFDFDEKDTK